MMRKQVRHQLLLLVFLFISSCSNQLITNPNVDSGGLINLPIQQWSQAVDTSLIQASIAVYDQDKQNKKIYESNLNIDAAGLVSSDPFKLESDQQYRFVIIFKYNGPDFGLVDFAYVDVTKKVTGDKDEVKFLASDIKYETYTSAAAPNLAADIASGFIPNLDSDGDGFSNFIELKDNTNVNEGKQIPTVPTLTITTSDPKDDKVIITLTAEDNHVIKDLRLLDSMCGIKDLTPDAAPEILTNGHQRLVKQFSLDLLSVNRNYNFRNIAVGVNDGVTENQIHDKKLNFYAVAQLAEVIFVFTDPSPDGEIEGLVNINGLVCSGDPFTSIAMKIGKENIQMGKLLTQMNNNGEYQVVFSQVETDKLPDGNTTFTVVLTDEKKLLSEYSANYKIANENNIKLQLPGDRRWLSGKEKITVNAINLPNTVLFTAEVDDPSIMTTISENANSSSFYLDVSKMYEYSQVKVKVRAVQQDGSEISRTINFEVRNAPQVFGISGLRTVLAGWRSDYNIIVDNADEVVLAMANKSFHTENCQLGLRFNGIKSCAFNYPVKWDKSADLIISAKNANGTLNPSYKYHVNFIDSGLSAAGGQSDLSSIALPTQLIIPLDYQTGQLKLYSRLADGAYATAPSLMLNVLGGQQIPLTNLKPFSDYRLSLIKYTLEHPEGTDKQELDFSTGDANLVLWLRMMEDPIAGLSCGGDVGEAVCDYSGFNNHASYMGNGWVLPIIHEKEADVLDQAYRFFNNNDVVSASVPQALATQKWSVFVKYRMNQSFNQSFNVVAFDQIALLAYNFVLTQNYQIGTNLRDYIFDGPMISYDKIDLSVMRMDMFAYDAESRLGKIYYKNGVFNVDNRLGLDAGLKLTQGVLQFGALGTNVDYTVDEILVYNKVLDQTQYNALRERFK